MPSRRTTAGAAALAGLIFTAGIAFAGNLGDFNAADSNHDGCVSQQEFVDYETGRLLSGSGFIAKKFQSLPPDQQSAKLRAKFQKLDTRHSGCLKASEWNGA